MTSASLHPLYIITHPKFGAIDHPRQQSGIDMKLF